MFVKIFVFLLNYYLFLKLYKNKNIVTYFKMKILQLSPRFPFPPDDGGKIVVANTYREFSALGANVILFSTNHEKKLYKDAIIEANQYGKSIIFRYNSKNNIPKIIKSIISNKPIYIQKFYSKKLISVIENIVKAENPDILHSEHTCMAAICLYIKEKYNIPFGIRLHNIEHNIWQRTADTTKNIIKYLYVNKQAKLLKKEEIRLIEQADINFAITEDEKNALLKLTNKNNIITASVGVHLDKWIPSDFSQRNKNQIVIATTFNWQPNVDAIRWFLENVMPIIYSKNPQAKMLIIGKNAPKWINKFNNIGTEYVGYVQDIKKIVGQSGIYVAPLFVGAGIRIKIIEAMAMGMPVVATPISASGIHATEKDGLFITDNSIDYANKILELMNNDEYRKNAGIQSRIFIENNFSWKLNVEKMLNEYEKILSNSKR